MILIKLDKIKENINYIKKYTKCEIIMVVKSNCYGLGSNYLIPFFKKIGIKYFFVNHYYEYLNNKEVLKNTHVIIMDSIKIKEEDNIIYTINNIDDAKYFNNTKKKINVHLQIDLGMNRLGIKSIEECIKILNILNNNKLVEIKGIYGHFRERCDNYYDYLRKCDFFQQFLKLYNFEIIHTAATPSLHKKIIGNYVRIGLSAYGYGNNNLSLQNTLSGYIKPINIIKLDIGDKIGYENKSKNDYIKENTKVMVIPLGYFENKMIKRVKYKNVIYEKIGTSCMNHTHFRCDDKINKLTYLSFLEKNDTIDIEDINWYHYLINLANCQKVYIMRYNYDLFRTIKYIENKGRKIKFRINCRKNINSRIIKL